ncbi:MAG TPA: CHRD domain-containing protein, partial [Desulfobaccales bacterium]|nr:CHRD domain-containing protein [Desulfobaccales bacterium]
NGPVAVWLYPSQPFPELKLGKFSGVLAEGTITARNLAGPLKGKSLSALLKDIKSNRAYVNVHTREHPEGALRGEIK